MNVAAARTAISFLPTRLAEGSQAGADIPGNGNRGRCGQLAAGGLAAAGDLVETYAEGQVLGAEDAVARGRPGQRIGSEHDGGGGPARPLGRPVDVRLELPAGPERAVLGAHVLDVG